MAMAMKDFTSHIVTSLIACVVAMMAFWMVEAREYITRAECEVIVQSQSPYAKDKSMILAEINRANESSRDLQQTMDQNNDVLNQLKIEMAVLNKTLQTMMEQSRQGNNIFNKLPMGTDSIASGR